MPSTNLSAIESQALSALATGGRVVNLLSPTGATRAAVGDILSAASDVVRLANTANAALANFTNKNIIDPIRNLFSTTPPYGGTFITAPTVTSIIPVDFSQLLSATAQALSQIPLAQIIALAARVGMEIVTDADLAIALASVFSQAVANFKLGFSIDLNDSSSITPIDATITPTQLAYTIPPLTANPNIPALSAFVSASINAFPHVTDISGVAASIWVDDLGVSVAADGAPIIGIPTSIDTGYYSDITTAANILTPLTPVTVVDYSYQQNQFNLVVALAIDNGLSATMTTLLTSSLVTGATYQLIKNRLLSVAQRGDCGMLQAMFIALGANNIPNATPVLSTLLVSLQPTDQATIARLPPVFTASGITVGTTSNNLSTAASITAIQAMLTLTGITITELSSQNTCNSVFCSQQLINVPLLRSMNQTVLQTLLDPTTVQMGLMF